jgi:hypothetical protein
VWASSASGDYPVYAGAGLLANGFWPVPGARFCVTDEHVGAQYAAGLGALAGLIEVPAGERTRPWTTAERVLRELAQGGLDQDGHVVALGGGVVGDLAGFCAAVYQRGVRVVQAPTTLVAQVDSAYGGKTGIDLPEGKNYAGAYHQPSAVMVDPLGLETLPAAELSAGWAEVIKTALIAGGPLWKRFASGPPAIDRDLVLACARTKLAVVAEDERDAGRRQTLNLGHTVGHALRPQPATGRFRQGKPSASACSPPCRSQKPTAFAPRWPSCSLLGACRRGFRPTWIWPRCSRRSRATRSGAQDGWGSCCSILRIVATQRRVSDDAQRGALEELAAGWNPHRAPARRQPRRRDGARRSSTAT